MASIEGALPRGNCAVCGKIIPVKDIRSKAAQFCSRSHASIARYSMRYHGTNSGRADRPKNLLNKTKEL